MDDAAGARVEAAAALVSKGAGGSFLNNLTIGRRVMLALAAPALALIGIVAASVIEDWGVRKQAEDVHELASFLPSVGVAVHELQKERGLSAGFIGSRGTVFAGEMQTQRAETDKALAKLNRDIAVVVPKDKGKILAPSLALFQASARGIPDMRRKIDRLNADDASSFYTEAIADLLAVPRRWATSVEMSFLDNLIFAYIHLVEAKEHAGQERAMGSAGAAAGQFGPSRRMRFIELGAEQRIYLQSVRDAVPPDMVAVLDGIEKAPPSLEVRRMRNVIAGLSSGGGGISAAEWFSAASARIDLLWDLETRLAARLDAAADGSMRSAGRSLGLHVALLVAALAIAAGIVVSVSHGISRPAARLAAAMERLARGDDTGPVEGADRGDEIGAMARAFEVFRWSETRIRLLAQAIEQAPAGVVIADADGKIVYVNPAVMRFSGRSREELIGRNPRIFASGRTPKDDYERLWRTLKAGRSWEGEILNRNKNGDFVWEHEVIAPVFGREGQITHYIAVKEDITARKRLEEHLHSARLAAEEANRSKSSFLANMSHELRTPLNAVLGFSEAIKLGIPAPLAHPKHVEYVGLIHQSAGYLLQLINEILDLSKIESGAMSLHETRTCPADIVETCVRMVRERASRKKINLEIDVADDCPCLMADERMVKQIVLNLLTNAIKFTPDEGRVALRIAVDRGDLVIRVADTGVGIRPEDMARIFTPFARVETDAYVRHQEGTGLGLVLTRKMVEMHGGVLGLDSVPGTGTTATVRFPASRLTAFTDRV